MANQGKLFFEANFGGGGESFIAENNIVSWGPYTPGYEDNTFLEEKLCDLSCDVFKNLKKRFHGCINSYTNNTPTLLCKGGNEETEMLQYLIIEARTEHKAVVI